MIQELKPRRIARHVSLAKCRRSLFPKQSQHRANKPYEIVYCDVCGLMQVESKGGSRYMFTFIDDFSRYTAAYFIKSKSEVLSKFMEYVNSVEKHTGSHKTEQSVRGRCLSPQKRQQLCQILCREGYFT